MITTTQQPSAPRAPTSEKAIVLALSLAHAEREIHEFSADQVDAILDGDGRTYLLRPAQELLREDEKRLKAIMNGSADIITLVNCAGVILSTNLAAGRIFGYAPEELIGKFFFNFIHDEDLPNVHFAYFGVIELFRNNTTVHFRHLTHDGSYCLIEASLGLLEDGSSPGVVFVLRPIASSIPAHIEHMMSRTFA